MSYGLVLEDENREAGSRPRFDLRDFISELRFVGRLLLNTAGDGEETLR